MEKVEQPAWIKARDTECASVGTFHYRCSGSADSHCSTRRDRTEERAAVLHDWAERLRDI